MTQYKPGDMVKISTNPYAQKIQHLHSSIIYNPPLNIGIIDEHLRSRAVEQFPSLYRELLYKLEYKPTDIIHVYNLKNGNVWLDCCFELPTILTTRRPKKLQ